MTTTARTLLALVSLLFLSPLALADDGGTYYPDNWTYGNIYVKESNRHVVLEKEYMYVTADNITAVFCFNNTSDSALIIPCAFPVVVSLPFALIDDSVCLGGYNEVVAIDQWQLLLDMPVELGEGRGELGELGPRSIGLPKADLEAYDKQLRVIPFSDYHGSNACTISQDGNDIPLKNVGIETSVTFESEKGNYAKIVRHFYHELSFEPHSRSIVVVRHPVNSAKSDFVCSKYQVEYDISTGATWKDGSIGSFVLLTDLNMVCPDGLQMSSVIPFNVYYGVDYKPRGSFHFTGQDSYCNEVYNRRFPDKGNYISLFKTPEGFRAKRPSSDMWYDPLVVDSALTFTVSEPCVGPFIANGFVDADNAQDNMELFNYFYDGIDPEMDTLNIDALWYSYSRIKSATLTRLQDGSSQRLDLLDRFPGYPYPVSASFNDGWYGTNAVRRVSLLHPGTYSLSVDEIYPGDSIPVPAFSHVWFYPVGQSLLSIIDSDAQSPTPIFPQVLNSLLNVHFSIEVPLLGSVRTDIDELRRRVHSNNTNPSRPKPQEPDPSSPSVSNVPTTSAEGSGFPVLPVAAISLLLLSLAAFFVLRRRRG
jgi:hypothetical protein